MTVAAANPLPHPCKGALALARITNRRIAGMLGIHESYVSRMLNGTERASPELRRVIAGLLDRPERELFRDE